MKIARVWTRRLLLASLSFPFLAGCSTMGVPSHLSNGKTLDAGIYRDAQGQADLCVSDARVLTFDRSTVAPHHGPYVVSNGVFKASGREFHCVPFEFVDGQSVLTLMQPPLPSPHVP